MRMGPVRRLAFYGYSLSIILLSASALLRRYPRRNRYTSQHGISQSLALSKILVTAPAVNSVAYADLNGAEALNMQFKDEYHILAARRI